MTLSPYWLLFAAPSILLRVAMLPYYQLSLRRCVHQRPLYLKFYSSQSSPKESPVKSTSKLEEDDDEDVVVPLPLLQRPLGVMEPPTTIRKTSKDALNDMMDQKKRTDNRNHMYVATHFGSHALEVNAGTESKRRARDTSQISMLRDDTEERHG